MRLLFVCTGNTCRSPMAEAMARHAAAQLGLTGVEVGSAGTAAYDGQTASPGAEHAMQARGLSLEAHRARRLTPELAEGYDLILTMTERHAQFAASIVPAKPIYALYEFVGEAGEVPDPWGGTDAVYQECARRMEPRIERAVRRIQEELLCQQKRKREAGQE